MLIQNGVRQGLHEDIRDGGNLVEMLKKFFAYREPHNEEWDAAVADFKDHIPQVAKGIKEKIEQQRRTSRAFVERFDAFYALCRQAINPNLSLEAVEEMLIQHLMTERIFRSIFDNPDFTRRNVIAVEIERVIDAMTKMSSAGRNFSRISTIFTAPSSWPQKPPWTTAKSRISSTLCTNAFSRAIRRKKPTPTASFIPRSPSWTSWCEAWKTF